MRCGLLVRSQLLGINELSIWEVNRKLTARKSMSLLDERRICGESGRAAGEQRRLAQQQYRSDQVALSGTLVPYDRCDAEYEAA
jgi:hypothetical protein